MSFGTMEPFHIILQARMASARLLGKALLPIAGLPSAVLAARRAARGGRAGLTVATADNSSCDPLASAMDAAGIAVYRGSENDVLGRFVGATKKLADNTIVVRLTADNVFPDGDFVAALATDLCDKGADIIGTASAKGLPYGLSAEAFRLRALRQAADCTGAQHDREHVTPWLYRNVKSAPFDILDGVWDMSEIRCTLDTADDYRTLGNVFEGIADPVAVGWQVLVERLAAVAAKPRMPA